LIESVKVASPQGSIITANLATENCDGVLGKLGSSENIFSNGATDLILVTFSNYGDQHVDQCLQRVNTYVQEHANQQYICLLSADESRIEPQLAFSPEKLLENDIVNKYNLLAQNVAPVNLHFSRKLLQADNGTNTTAPFYVGPQYISPAILFGILLGFVLIFFLWQGIYQLTQIEAPVRFSHTKLQLSREY